MDMYGHNCTQLEIFHMKAHRYPVEWKQYSLSTGNALAEASLDPICLFNDCNTLVTHAHPLRLIGLCRSFSSSFFLIDGFSVELIAEFFIICSQEHDYVFYTTAFCTIECYRK